MRHHLLSGAALAALLTFAATAASAAEAADAGGGADATVEEVVIYGQGQSRQVQTLQGANLVEAAPGTSPIKMVDKLPGVNFQSADAFGAYEWSTRISIRGFNQNQLGFTLDGVPLGDMSYGNYNGLHISRAIASEDVGRVELAQGSGGLGVASSSNLGGALKFISRSPQQTFGVYGAVTGGSQNTTRWYLDLETGVLPSGGRAYLSFANQDAQKWKGQGSQKQKQLDFKFVQPIGSAQLTGFVDVSRRRENDYQDLSLGMIQRLGYGWDNITGQWNLAVQIADIANNRGDTGAPVTNAAAGTVYPAPIQTVDDAYYDASGLRNDTLWGATLDVPFGEALNVTGTVYGHKNRGQGTWYTPYVASPNAFTPGATTDNAPISVRTTEYDIDRTGALGSVRYDIGGHALEAGFWYENNDFNQARRFYGLNRAAPQRDSLHFMENPFATQWAYSFNTKTTNIYVQDTWTLNDAVKVNFGFKSLQVKSTGTTTFGSPVINGSIESKDSFLPQVGVTWKVGEGGEAFASYTENMRAFGAAHTGLSPFATTQAGFAAIQHTLKPETSKTVEGGLRFHNDSFQGVVAVYYVKFDNRLIGTAAGAGIVGNPTILSNVGSVTSKGFEAAATWDFAKDWSLFGSYAFNDSKYDDNTVTPSGTVLTGGKQTVDTPRNLLKVELAFDNGPFYVKAGAHYTDKRFFTYTNDRSVGSYTLVDLSAGFRVPGDGWMKGVEIQLNVTNLFDKKYVSTIGSNGFGNSGDNQTLLAGAPRQAYLTLRKSF